VRCIEGDRGKQKRDKKEDGQEVAKRRGKKKGQVFGSALL